MKDYKVLLEEFKELLKQEFQPGDVVWNNKYLPEETKPNNSSLPFQDNLTLRLGGLFWSDPEEGQVNERKKIIQDFFNKRLGKNQKIKENSNQIISSFLEELTLQKYLEIEEPKHNNGTAVNSFNKNSDKLKIYKCCLSLFLTNVVKNEIFFAREFNNEKTKKFFQALKKKIQDELKMGVIMLEEDVKSGNLNSRIKNEIESCKYLIADLTYDKSKGSKINNNVMYEIGLAHGLNKKVLMIMNEEVYPFNQTKLPLTPFDISSHTTIPYSFNDSFKDIDEIIKAIKKDLI